MTHTSTDGLLQAGLAILKTGDIDGALLRFEQARQQDPANIAVLRIATVLYRRNGRWPQAWSTAETGLALQPDDPEFSDARMAVMAEAGFTAAALTLARRAAEARPQDAQVQVRLSDLLLRTGQTAAALNSARAALQLVPDHAEALLLAAEAAFRLADHAAAQRWLDQAVALEPENRSIRMARATILLSLGIWDPGLHDYEYRLLPGGPATVQRIGLMAPRWQGQEIGNGRLLVVAEQGVGDQMRFLRDILAARRFCKGMIVECAARLVPLFRRSLPADIQVTAADEYRSGAALHRFDYGWLQSQPPVDAWIEMGSLMLRLLEHGIRPERPGA
jgi:tetratricopeptide (TPR) repeat protein